MKFIQFLINNWQAIGGTALITGILTYIQTPKIKKATEKQAKEEAEGQGIINLDKILLLNAREIDRIKKSFKEQLEPLHQIIEDQKMITGNQKIIIDDQKKIIESQTKYIAKLDFLVAKYKLKFGEIT